MSEYSFDVDDDSDDGQAPGSQEQQAPKWYRDKLAADSQAMQRMREELDQLRQESRRDKVAKALGAAGYDPAAATLYAGEPESVADWLSTHGALLAKRPEGADAPQGGEQAPSGPPASTVPPEVQAQMQSMQAAGVGASPTRGSDAELAAQLAAAKSPEDLAAIMRANGNQFML